METERISIPNFLIEDIGKNDQGSVVSGTDLVDSQIREKNIRKGFERGKLLIQEDNVIPDKLIPEGINIDYKGKQQGEQPKLIFKDLR